MSDILATVKALHDTLSEREQERKDAVAREDETRKRNIHLQAALDAMTAKRDALFEEATKMGREAAAKEESAFRLGYRMGLSRGSNDETEDDVVRLWKHKKSAEGA